MTMKTHKKPLQALLFYTLLPLALVSASLNAYALEPETIDFEGGALTPTLEISSLYDDNILATNDPKSSWITSIKPTLALGIQGEKASYGLSYTLDHKMYASGPVDSLNNHSLKALADFPFDVRNRLKLKASMNKTESIDNVFVLGTLNQFSQNALGGSYVYGAPTATGNIELEYNHGSLRTDNNINLDQERDSDDISTAFVYRVTDKTRLLAELRAAQYNYVSNTTLDSTSLAYLVGARWEASAKTAGSAKFGTEQKDYKDNTLSNASRSTWEVSVDWSPLTYSTVTLATSQKIEEGAYGASYIDTTKNGIVWSHDWDKGLDSQFGYAVIKQDYSDGRVDDITTFNASLKYKVRRWLDASFNFQHSEQNSPINERNFSRNVFRLTLNASL